MEPEDGAEDDVPIEVVCAAAHEQVVIAIRVSAGTTAREALTLSGAAGRFGIEIETAELGIYGRRVSHDTVVAAGDRVEIYRPLIADPKQARRRRARQSG